METHVQDPGKLFHLPQTLVIPLFQRPYVWTEERQWTPLWEDVERLVDLRMTQAPSATHFLGAVVMQRHLRAMGFVSEYALIDGQQRLTTLQLLLNACSAAMRDLGHAAPANNLRKLTLHDEGLGIEGVDRLKVRHTNSDGVPFQEVMLASSPAEIDASDSPHLITSAYLFFYGRASAWLAEGTPEDSFQRSWALATTLMQGLEIVVISLDATEDSQSIFETLNARGTPLTQADLAKNLVFQRLEAEGSDIRRAYEQNWSLFDETFWTSEVRLGRFTISHVSLFLNHWLVARTGEEVRTPATFTRFKHWLTYENTGTVLDIVQDLHDRAVEYQRWIRAAQAKEGPVSTVELFFYRTLAADMRTVAPFALWLFDPANSVPPREAEAALTWFESWVIRRAILGLPSADVSRTVAHLITELKRSAPDAVALTVRDHLQRLDSPATYWPSDDELRRELHEVPIYRKLSRSRLRMVLEAIEDDARGYTSGQGAWSGSRVPRDTMNIEHILPRRWRQNWPVASEQEEIERDSRIHRLGNLTLLTTPLNSSLSNRAWSGAGGKREVLTRHDVLLVNRPLRDADGWDEESIDRRTGASIDALIRTWPAPDGHSIVPEARKGQSDAAWIDFRRIVAAGLVAPGTRLRPRGDRDVVAVVLADGRIEVDGVPFDSPSGSAAHVRGGSANGWTFWQLPDGQRLNALKNEYRKLVDEQRDRTRRGSGTED
ncbi:GmrSD restriction endonuclease domain-containing protein [Brachybacterium phenoliresistens]|uniref:GmrSD restriction endonuclease domain-containing protein n=1 Tax=Brachybacterium phenoliresistens TaxID=396014 RepID=UPI0031E223B4